MTPLNKFSRIFMFTTVGLMGGAVGYNIQDRSIPVAVLEIGAATPEVEPGGIFRARYKFYRHRSCATHIERFIFDGTRQRFVIPDIDFPQGILPTGEDIVFVPAPVSPAAVPSDQLAVYTTLNCYKCNFTHKLFPVCDSPREIRFKIVEPK